MGGFWGKFLCILLGFLLGVVGAFGGVVGAGYYIGSLPIKEATTTIDSFSGAGMTDLFFGKDGEVGLLNPSYSDKYVKDLLADTTTAIGEISKGGSLQSLNNISPKIGEMLEKLTKTTNKYGIKLDSAKLLSIPLQAREGEQGLTDYFVEGLKGAALGDMLTGLGEPPSGLFEYLCYGEEGIDFDVVNEEIVMKDGKSKTTIKDLLGGDLMSIFSKVPLAAVTTPNVGDSAMLTISYGREGITYSINNKSETGVEADVTMLPMFYEIGEDSFVDYSGAKVEGTVVTPDVSGYTKFQLPTAEGEEAEYIYLLNPASPETKYFVYEKLSDGTMQSVPFSKTKLSALTDDTMGVIDKILLKDVLSGEGEKTNAVLESLCYDKDGNPNSIGQLRNQGGALVDQIPLDAIITPEDSNLILYLLYGHEGKHFTTSVVDGKTQYDMLQKFIGIYEGKAYNEYGELLSGTVDTTAKTYSFTEGDKTITYSYQEAATDKVALNIQATTDTNEDGVVNHKDKVIVYRNYLFDGATKVMFEETTLGDFARTNNKLDTITDHLTVKDIFGEDVCNEESANYNPILAALANSAVGNIGEDVKHVPLKSLFSKEDLDNNQLLTSLSDSTLATLSSDINTLTLAGILGEEKIKDNAILKNLATSTILSLPDDVNKLTVEQVLHDQIYNYDAATDTYTDGKGNIVDKTIDGKINPLAVKSTWRYLLNDKTYNSIKTDYKLLGSGEGAGMDCLIDNMVYNIHEATLQQLKDDELIDFNDSMLGEPIRRNIGSYVDFSSKLPPSIAGKNDMGELTVTEILDYVEILFEAMNQVETMFP